ncbi:MAG: hypothetical protein WBB31_17285, partial [Saprospiraceae bacterium]
ESGSPKPAMILSKVDFPEPFLPIKAAFSPYLSANDTLSSNVLSPKVNFTSFTNNIAAKVRLERAEKAEWEEKAEGAEKAERGEKAEEAEMGGRSRR